MAYKVISEGDLVKVVPEDAPGEPITPPPAPTPKPTSAPKPDKSSKVVKILGITLCVVTLLALATWLIVFFCVPKNEPASSGGDNGGSQYPVNYDDSNKKSIRDRISKITFYFDSDPDETLVIYDFENKTKTIEDTSFKSTYGDFLTRTVSYDRFDELFSILYDTLFQSKEPLDGAYGRYNEGAPKSYYDIKVEFKGSDAIMPLGNLFKYYKDSDGHISWLFNGYTFPSNWEQILSVAEIGEDSLTDGVTFDFKNSPYAKK